MAQSPYDFLAKWLIIKATQGNGAQALALLDKVGLSTEFLSGEVGELALWLSSNQGQYNPYLLNKYSQKLFDYVTGLGITQLSQATDGDLVVWKNAIVFDWTQAQLADILKKSQNSQDMLNRVMDLQLKIVQTGNTNTRHVLEVAEDYIKNLDEWEKGNQDGTLVRTGFAGLDSRIGGLWRGEVAAILGGTGSGKSAMAKDIALNVAKRGQVVLYVTLEMDDWLQVMRLVSSVNSVNNNKLLFGHGSKQDYETARETARGLDLPLYFIDNPYTQTSKIRSEMLLLGHVDLVIIDYGRLLQDAQENQNEALRAQRIAGNLKALARIHQNSDGTKPAFLAIWDAVKDAFEREDFTLKKEDTAWGGHSTFATIIGIMEVHLAQYKHDKRHKTLLGLLGRLFKTKIDKEYSDDWLLNHETGVPFFGEEDRVISICKSRFSDGKMHRMQYLGKYTRWEELQ